MGRKQSEKSTRESSIMTDFMYLRHHLTNMSEFYGHIGLNDLKITYRKDNTL